ncbi:MAG: 4Fe-4S binding protein [Limnochordia bacterium]|jgi:ferredoxin|nr:4Fe-4S binding protein [Limnochordia bacterium]MDD4518368.1 NIL domain-containing protein [Limnochordia bacterium]
MSKARVWLSFPPGLVDKPLTYRLVKDYDLAINILRAKVTPKEEGRLLVEIENSTDARIESGLEYLKSQGVRVELIGTGIIVNTVDCVHCGACTAVCASGALSIEPQTAHLKFDDTKCVGCELCVTACPISCIEASF